MVGLTETSAPLANSRLFRRLGFAGVNGVAWLIYGVGLISPLTPSEGMPGVVDLLIFVVGPIALLVLVALR